MDNITKALSSKTIHDKSKEGDIQGFMNSVTNVIDAILDCQVKTGERIKLVLDSIVDIKQQFTTCPAKMNDGQDHAKIAELESRVLALEKIGLVEKVQRETIGKMAKALYAIGGVIGGAGLFKLVEILGKILN